MEMFFGILLIIAGSFFSLCTLLFAIECLLKALSNFSSGAYGFGYTLGQFIVVILFVFISYWLIKKGVQLIKNKKKEESVMSKINSIR